jgi:hypothetical protein
MNMLGCKREELFPLVFYVYFSFRGDKVMNKGVFTMGRGVHFQHKLKGHDHEKPKHGKNVPPKHTEQVEYEIGTVATEEGGPVSVKVEKDL